MMRVSFSEPGGIFYAFKAMRLSFKSLDRMDTSHLGDIGPADFELAMKLNRSGPSHAKFMRLINVWVEIKAPRYWWQEFDTYRYGNQTPPFDWEGVSESTMHTLAKEIKRAYAVPSDITPAQGLRYAFTEETSLFSIWNLMEASRENDYDVQVMKANLPEGFIQGRIGIISFQTLRSIYFERRNHRLKEWKIFCQAIERIKNSELITKE